MARSYRAYCRVQRPNLYSFLEFLQWEQSYIEGNLAKAEAGISPEPQKKKWRDSNERIVKTVNTFSQSETKDYIGYLKSVAHNINFSVGKTKTQARTQTQNDKENE